MRTEEQVIADSYDKRQFIIEAAFQEGAIPSLQAYNEMSTELWAQGEAEKLRIAIDGAEARKQASEIEFASQQTYLNATSSILGSLSTLVKGRSKEQFENSKSLAIASTIVQTYAAAQAHAAAATTYYEAIAIVAADLTAGFARVNAISSTKFGSTSAGGSSVGSSISGSSGGSTPTTGQVPQTTGNGTRGGVTNITFVADKNGTVTLDADQMDALAQQMAAAVDRGDLVLITPGSYNAQLLQGAA